MNESQSTHKVLSNSPKRVWWLRPLVGTLGLGSLVAACGGPANIIDLAVPQALAIAAGVSAFIGALLVLWFLWKPFNLSPGLHSGLGVGTSVILGLTLRQIMSNEPVLGSIIFGAIGGYCVAASLLPSKLHPTVW